MRRPGPGATRCWTRSGDRPLRRLPAGRGTGAGACCGGAPGRGELRGEGPDRRGGLGDPGGNPDWAHGRRPAARHAEAVRRLLDGGARFVGKTHTDELSRGIFGETGGEGAPVNPRAPHRLPGGSSSGSAVAVAAGQAALALGTDTGGSVRAPASFCGVFGMRPTHGRVPFEGVLPQAPSFDTLGWLAADGATLAQAGAVLLDPMAAPPAPERLVFATDIAALADPAAARAALGALPRRLGEATEAAFCADPPVSTWAAPQGALQSREAWDTFADWIDRRNPRFSWEVALNFLTGRDRTAGELEAAAAFRAALRARTPALFDGGRTVFAFPATPFGAPPRGLRRTEAWALRARVTGMTAIAGLLGAPVVVLPLAEVEGLPLGLALMGAPGSDEALLSIAARA
ncbi:amidase family protein [Roseomonas sp. CCTCC AB2023176]|uniref:amidase family protein n=1 Tax=Roseomonas sp. CCTCC AB2023176 TaxID=3342640 RepID=UPI0035DAC6C1